MGLAISHCSESFMFEQQNLYGCLRAWLYVCLYACLSLCMSVCQPVAYVSDNSKVVVLLLVIRC